MKQLIIVLLLISCAFASDVTRGNQVDAVIRDSTPLYEDSDVCARVNEVGQKVVAASGNESRFSFHFYVLNSPDNTTFSAPGGSVYITTGLLRHLQSEDELAVMLGHEIAHINKHHMMKTEGSEHSKIFWSRVLVVGSIAASAFAGAVVQVETAKAFTNTVAIVPAGQGQYQVLQENTVSPQLANLTSGAVAWGTANGGLTLLDLYYQGYKDEYEFAADKSAIEYAEKAGYDGAAMEHVLSRLGGSTGETNSTQVSNLHSSSKSLQKRTAAARGQGDTPQQHNP